MLQSAYEAKGLVYGGRTLYTDYNPNEVLVNQYGEKYVHGSTYVHTNDKDAEIGYAGVYKKMVPEIHREVLGKIYDDLYKSTNKHILDKFNSYKLSGNSDGITKIIKTSLELMSDIRQRKAWMKEIEGILKNIEKQQLERLKKLENTLNNKKDKHIVSITELEKIGRAILGRAIELCPIETGFLRQSGTLYVFGDYIKIIFECPYSLYVHENVNNYHAFGQAKFLETAAQEMLRNTSVWVESSNTGVLGNNMQLTWARDSNGHAIGMPNWVEQKAYRAVYIDIDRDLKVTYAH